MPKKRKNELSFWSSADRERFNKNLVLLSILNEVPKKPTKHHLRERSKGTSGNGIQEGLASRTLLPVNEESHIAEALAFTTVMCHDRNAIMAVCIEQHEREPGLTFRIAANSGDLSKVAQGLVKMGSVLEQAAQRDSAGSFASDHNSLLIEVVTLCRIRILERLRSRHAPRPQSGKSPPKPLISRLLQAVLKHAKTRPSSVSLRQLSSALNELQGISNQIERLDTSGSSSEACIDFICRLVTCAHKLSSDYNLEGDLAAMGNDVLQGSERNSLVCLIRKIGKYDSHCRYLVSAARKFACFKSIQVKLLTPPVEVPYQVDKTCPSAADHLLAVFQTQPHLLRRGRGAATIQMYKSASSKAAQFASQLQVPRRVHAEIQLLFFYEAHPEISPPRIITSRKDACFLCDLFVQLHGGFQLRKTHGRLYHRWTLPEPPSQPAMRGPVLDHIHSVVRQMNQALEEHIRSTILDSRRPYLQPNESTITASIILSSQAASITPDEDRVPGSIHLSRAHVAQVKASLSNHSDLYSLQQEPVVSTSPNPARPHSTSAFKDCPEGFISSHADVIPQSDSHASQHEEIVSHHGRIVSTSVISAIDPIMPSHTRSETNGTSPPALLPPSLLSGQAPSLPCADGPSSTTPLIHFSSPAPTSLSFIPLTSPLCPPSPSPPISFSPSSSSSSSSNRTPHFIVPQPLGPHPSQPSSPAQSPPPTPLHSPPTNNIPASRRPTTPPSPPNGPLTCKESTTHLLTPTNPSITVSTAHIHATIEISPPPSYPLSSQTLSSQTQLSSTHKAGTQCATCRVHVTLLAPNHSVASVLESHHERLFDVSALPDTEDKVIPGDGNLKGTLYLTTRNRSTLIRLQWEWTAQIGRFSK